MAGIFLNPWALLFGTAAAGIILLYILKLKRKRQAVSSVLLWDKSVYDSKANVPWQKLKHNWLMYLQILLILLLATALARPFFLGNAAQAQRTVVVLDTSTSMLAREGGRSRYELAQQEAINIVQGKEKSDEIMIMAAGSVPRILMSFSADSAELVSAVRGSDERLGGTCRINEALKLIAAIAANDSMNVLLISDGAIEAVNENLLANVSITYIPVGSPAENTAIRSVGARYNPFTGMYEILSSVANYSSSALSSDVALYLGDEIIDVKTVELSPGQSSELVFEDVVYTEISYRILLDHEDDLPIDNEAHVVLPDPRGVDVAYASETDSYLLESAIRSIPDLKVYTGAEISEAENIDVWIVEGRADYTVDENANYMFFNSATSTLAPVRVIGDITLDVTTDPPVVPTVTQVESTHPVLRFVNISDLVLYSMQDVELKDWARVLVGTSEGPLIIEGLYHSQNVIYVACDLYDTSMPFKAAFPIMLSNAIRYLGVGGTRHDQLNTLVGDALNVTTPAEASYVLLENRGRDSVRFEVNNSIANAGYIFDPGVYEFGSYSGEGELLATQQYAVNALHADESRLLVVETIGVEAPEGENTIQANKEYLTNKEYYLWLLVIAIIIVGLEWFAFHTKSL